jgi:Ca2+-binding RTX toxin-like protein
LTTFERRGGDILANTATSGHQDGGQVVFLADGRFVIVWRDSSATGGDTSGTAIRGQIFNADGSRSGGEFLVNTTTAGYQNNPTLIALPGGGFVVAWTDARLDGTDAEIRAQIFDSAGARSGAEILVNTTLAGVQNMPSGAAMADGSFVLSWTDSTAEPAVAGTGGSPIGVRAQLFDSAGTKLGAETAVNTSTRYEQSNPSVAALAGGGYVIAWQDVNSGGIMGQRFAGDGSRVGDEFLISTVLSGTQLDASVAALAGGGFVVTWTDFSGIGGDIHYTGVKAQIYDSAGAKVGGEFLANTDTRGYQQYSFVTGTASGGFLVMWSNTTSTVSDGSGSGVKAQYFDSAGAREGGEFWVNSTKLNDQFGTAIAANADGVVAVFADLSGTGGDSSGSSIKFDRFIAAPGTEGADILTGTDAEDSIHGFGGDDQISGAGAADLLDGGDGDDQLTGGEGDDDLFGGAGMDSLLGEGGADVLNGDGGDDSLDGGDGADGIAGGAGDDVLVGGAGNDTLIGDVGHDELDGGEGDDDLYYQFLGASPDHDSAAGGAGVDALFADFAGIAGSTGVTMTLGPDAGGGDSGLISAGADYSVAFSSIELFFIAATDFADQLVTGGGDDLLLGMGGDDVIEAGGGNDYIIGGAGADSMSGGLGNDRYEVDDAGDLTTENAGEGIDEIQVRLGAYTLGADFENLTGLLATGQSLTGNGLANLIKGGSGNDVIDGGAGADSMLGGAGNDVYHVDNAGDTVTEGAGTDEIRVSLASYSIADNIYIENLTGTSGSGQVLTGNDLANAIRGAGGDDVLSGGIGADQIFGGGGDDRIDGGAGVDSMTGGDGDDSFAVDDYYDSIVEAEGGGVDEALVGSAVYYILPANVENGTAVGGGWHQIYGNALGNVLRGGADSDWLNGQGGDDTMIGGKGYDTYYVDSLGDVIVEEDDDFQSPPGAYGDTVITTLAEYSLRADLEKLNGNSSQQRLVGNDKDNELWSGGGSDTLVGGKGNDYYLVQPGDVVVELEGEGTDTVSVGSGNYTLGDTLENLSGGSSSGQALTGNRFANRITGSSGADIIDGAGGADQLEGGGGNDVYVVDEAGDTVTESSSGGTDEVRTALSTYVLGSNVENFRGLSATGQTAHGNTLSNAMTGGEGDDVLRMEAGGTDVLRRGGTDIAAGNGGNDTLVFGAGLTGTDQANGGAGVDRLILQGNYNLVFGASTVQGIETLTLLTHTDGSYGEASATPFAYRLTSVDGTVVAGETMTVDARALAQTESLNFNGAAETNGRLVLLGGRGADTLTGGSGGDLLDGGVGADVMTGGKGDDAYVVSENADQVSELSGEGLDEVRTAIASYTLGANVENLAGLSSGGQTLIGNGLANSITGGDGQDFLDGRGGDDILRGGLGNDYYFIDSAGDQIIENSNEGIDEVRAGIATYTLLANFENLTAAASGPQILTGNGKANIIAGGSFGDRLDGAAGADVLQGWQGDDVYVVDNAGDEVREQADMGTDRVETALAAYAIGDNVENLTGTSASGQTLTGNALANAIQGGSGNDLLAGGGGDDSLNGGGGFDTLSYAAAGATGISVSVNSAFSGTVVGAPDVGTDSFAAIEKIVGGVHADTFTNNVSTGMTFAGGGGDDQYYLLGAADILVEEAGGGTDRVLTSAAAYTLGAYFENLTGLAATSQTLRGNWLDNSVQGGGGHDLLRLEDGGRDRGAGGEGDDQLYFGAGFDSLDLADGGAGSDTLILQGSYSSLVLSGSNLSGVETLRLLSHHQGQFGGADASADFYRITVQGIEAGIGFRVEASALDSDESVEFDASGQAGRSFLLYGGAGADMLKGGALADILDGGAGADSLYGGKGDDEYKVDHLGDLVVEAADEGLDEVFTGLAAYTLAANAEWLTGTSSSGQALTGNSGDNAITGWIGADVLAGGGGAYDSLFGGLGNDRLLVDAAPGRVYASGDGGSDILVVNYGATAGSVTMESPISTGPAGHGGGYRDGLGAIVVFSQIEKIDITTGGRDDDVATGDGDDRVVLNGGDDFASVGRGTDYADGGSGVDGISADLEAAQSAILWNLQANSFSGPGIFRNFEYFGQIRTGLGNDVIVTASGGRDESIQLGGGDDSATILDGLDQVDGGAGSDTLIVDYSAAATAIEATGMVRLADGWSGAMGEAAGRAVAFSGIDRFLVTGGSAGDSLAGGDGGDRLDGGGGDDRLSGGAGDDLYILDSAGDEVVEEAGQGTDEVRTSASTYALAANVENLIGASAAGQDLGGNSLDNAIRSGDGDDTIRLEDGGDDRVLGGWGDDVFWFGAEFDPDDHVEGDGGVDEVVLQGSGYGALAIGAGMLPGIQQLTLLSASDDRFGAASPSSGPYSYSITLAAGALDSAGYMIDDIFLVEPYVLFIDGRGLAAGEVLTVDASALGSRDVAATGGAADDRLKGGAGDDAVTDGVGGDDILEGGSGNDIVQDFGSGSDLLRGGEGDDHLTLFRLEGTAWGESSLEGGEGSDDFRISTWSAASVTVDAGGGDDRVMLEMVTGSVALTLGGGRDTILTSAHLLLRANAATIAVTDFETGASGDRLDWASDLHWKLIGWTEGSNPFASGHARLIQSGSDTLLQLSERADGNFYTLIRFENRRPDDFTGENFDGWSPLALTGGPGSDQLAGTPSSDFVFAGEGNDFIRLQQGGDDQASGGPGNDVFLFGGALNGADRIDGGDGTDQLAIQGDYAGAEALTLGSNVAGIENVAILPGDDTRFGDPGTNVYDYEISASDSAVGAGVQMVIDANRLRPGEDFSFDGSAELDGSFFIYGGGGTDLLTGGAKNDVFLFGAWGQWNPADVITGGAGIDQLALRGNYSLTFGAGQLVGIENIGLLSAHDTRFGALGSSYSYDLKTVDENVAPGVQMVVDGAKLRFAEFFRFDGSAETDGSFRIFGGLVDDVIVGSRNGDILQGYGGSDQLTGGEGGDAFRYVAASDSAPGSADRILDFIPGTDWIDLSRIDADSHAAGNQAFRWIGSNGFTGANAASAGELRAYQSGSNWFVEGDTDGNGSADLVIEVTAPTPLTADNFLL